MTFEFFDRSASAGTRPQDFRCRERLQVRWAEVDAQKIVFNGHYLLYADVAVSAYWRQVGFCMAQCSAAWGGELYVKKSELTYHASAHMGDVLDLRVRCVRLGGSSLQLEVGIFRSVTLLNTVRLVYVWTTPPRQPSPLPEQLRELISAYEAGAPTMRLVSGNWNDLGRAAERLRIDVFVREQGVPRELEIDEFDPVARHVVVFNRIDQPVATGRLVSAAPGVGRIGRMAVHRDLRGGALGRQVLDALVQAAQDRGDTAVVLHAQCHAQGFYERAGFVAEGDVFDEAGIAHITMRRVLSAA